MSSVAIGIATVAVAAGSAAMQASAAEDAEDQAHAAEQNRLRLNAEDRRRIDRLIRKLPQQEREATVRIMQTYARQRDLLDMAKQRGDQDREALFSLSLKQVEDAMNLQLSKLGENYNEYTSTIDAMRDKVKDLVESDQRVNRLLKKDYDLQTQAGFDNIKAGNEILKRQVDHIKATGFTPEAANVIAEAEKKVNETQRELEVIESNIGKGGAGSRRAANAFEKIATIAGVKIQAAADSREALNQAAGFAQLAENLAGRRTEVLRETEGREIADIESRFDEAKINELSARQARELGAVVGAGQAEQHIQREDLRTQILSDEAHAKDLANLEAGEAAAIERNIERTQSREEQLTGGVIQQNRSLSDIYAGIAQRNFNQANNLTQQAQASFATLGSMLALGAAGSQGSLPGQGVNDRGFRGFGQGVIQGGFGVKPKGFYNLGNNNPNQIGTPVNNSIFGNNPNRVLS